MLNIVQAGTIIKIKILSSFVNRVAIDKGEKRSLSNELFGIYLSYCKKFFNQVNIKKYLHFEAVLLCICYFIY